MRPKRFTSRASPGRKQGMSTSIHKWRFTREQRMELNEARRSADLLAHPLTDGEKAASAHFGETVAETVGKNECGSPVRRNGGRRNRAIVSFCGWQIINSGNAVIIQLGKLRQDSPVGRAAYREWDANGTLVAEEYYMMGKAHDPKPGVPAMRWWFPNGRPHLVAHCHQGSIVPPPCGHAALTRWCGKGHVDLLSFDGMLADVDSDRLACAV